MKAIQVNHLTKKFGAFTAVNDICLSINKGEIHAICGENGAGKSTLMNLLFGLLQPSSGELLINETPVTFASPKDAIGQGIGMVHQHFKLVPSLKIYENVLLGEELTRGGKIDQTRELAEVKKTIDTFGFDLNAEAVVGALSIGEQQRVEIVKMLHRNVDILILDEPTAVLTPRETDELLEKLIQLKQQGKTILIITHKLDEVKRCSDRITVIRKGAAVTTVETGSVTQQQISNYMVGRDVQTIRSLGPSQHLGENAFELRNICQRSVHGTKSLDAISLHVKYGEIVGIAGIEGNGQSELINILTGVTKPTSGAFLYKNQYISKPSPSTLRRLGFGLVPEDRYREGLNADMSVWENLIAGRHKEDGISSFGFLNRKKIVQKTNRLVQTFDIRNCNDFQTKVSSLSGGNAQKVVMARELSSSPDVIIMSQPTRGVDVGSIEFIHSKLLELRNSGRAVFIVSSELSEILNLSDRIYVLHQGCISGERIKSETNKEDLGMLMVGIDQTKGNQQHTTINEEVSL